MSEAIVAQELIKKAQPLWLCLYTLECLKINLSTFFLSFFAYIRIHKYWLATMFLYYFIKYQKLNWADYKTAFT